MLEIAIIFCFVLIIFFLLKNKPSKNKYHEDYRKIDHPVIKKPNSYQVEARPANTQNKEIVLAGTAYVVDGDTVVIQKTQMRLFGIDAPELNHPYGQKAKWALVSLCKGHCVQARVICLDDHGRTVARCYLPDGRDLSAEMVKLGMAIDWPKFSGGEYRALEVHDIRKKHWLADARQKGRMHVWEKYDAWKSNQGKQE